MGFKSIQWSNPMERALLEALLDQVRKGKRAESGFKAEAWKAVLKRVQAQVVQKDKNGKIRQITQVQASNKQTDLKGLYTAWKGLFTASGFGWNDELEIFEAEDDVWDVYIKAHPKARRIRHTPLPYHDMMLELFSPVAATGKHVRSAASLATPSSSQEELTNALDALDSELDEVLDNEKETASSPPEAPTTVRKLDETDSEPRKRRKATGGEAIAKSIGQLAEVMVDNLKKRETQYEQQGKSVYQRAVLLLHDQHRSRGAPWLFQASHALDLGQNALIYLATSVENREDMMEEMLAAADA